MFYLAVEGKRGFDAGGGEQSNGMFHPSVGLPRDCLAGVIAGPGPGQGVGTPGWAMAPACHCPGGAVFPRESPSSATTYPRPKCGAKPPSGESSRGKLPATDMSLSVLEGTWSLLSGRQSSLRKVPHSRGRPRSHPGPPWGAFRAVSGSDAR
ncbi:hypothetical protein HEK616_33190 [Streptomyces nigrescens]|uniref:Uncharacterized protein n=1 Tax=Streptomyces nigrescens TaxID=1920 RepID=A0ABN6QUK0_STRNI|nr:hypothetical protein HEK616_33190 [Streptomyces nigrescens]